MPLSTIDEHSHEEESSFEDNVTDGIRKEDDKHQGFTAAIFYLVVVFAVGIPVWLKTTTPVRYSVPDVAGLMVHTQMMVHRVPVEVLVVDEDSSRGLSQSLKSLLPSRWQRQVSPDGSSSFLFNWTVSSIHEQPALKAIFQGTSLKNIDELLQQQPSQSLPMGCLRVYVVNKSFFVGQKIMFGRSRFIFASSQEDVDESVDEVIASAVLTALEQKKTVSDDKKDESSDIIDPNINFFVNILFEEAVEAKSFKESGRLQEVHSLLKHAFLEESGISQFLNIKVSTRMVYYALDSRTMSSLVTHVGDSERGISVHNMPLLINSIESRVVDSDTTSSFHLNLIIPSSSQPSLVFVKTQKRPKSSSTTSVTSIGDLEESRSNTLLTSSKTGFIVWNRGNDLNLGLKVLVRRLLGLSQSLPSGLLSKDIFFSGWELDSLQRTVCQKQLLRSLSSLESVEKLLGKVGNIVIKKEVSDKMHLAVDLNHEALNHLSEGRLQEAFAASSRAYFLSEKAFFDPSLLALLYFPDDQKYAVYFPLFLPVSLPLGVSVYYIVKYIWNSRRRKSEDTS